MSAHRDLAIVVGAAVSLFVVYSALEVIHVAPSPKGNRLTVSPPTYAPPSVVAPAPAVTEPAPPKEPAFEPVAAGPAPAETAPPKAVTASHIRHPSKRRARRIAKAKAEPCVGPLCVLVRKTGT